MAAGPSPTAPPVLEISARLIGADGQPIAGASKTGSGDFQGFVWSDSSCALASGDREASKTPAIGWQFTAHVQQLNGDILAAEIEWQRVWDDQKRIADGPKGKVSRGIRMGDRVEIDRFDPGASLRSCGASAVQLEATAMRAATTVATGPGSGARAGGRGAGGRGGSMAGAGDRGGSGVGAGGGRGVGQGQQGAQGQQGQQGRQGQQGQQGQDLQRLAEQLQSRKAMAGRGGAGGRGSSASTFNVELWLVHTVPAGASGVDQSVLGAGGRGGRGGRGGTGVNSDSGTTVEREVAHQSLRFEASGSGFAFPAMSIATSRGTVGVIVTGTLNAKVDNGAPTTLVVTVNRQAISPDGSVSTSGGSSTKEIAWPATGDVISFELPAATGAGQDPVAQEKLSIRLRVGSGMGAGQGFKGARGGRGSS
jgi:hypothetical protein